MGTKCILFCDDDEVIDNAEICFFSNNNVILKPFSEDTLTKFNKGERMRFQYENKYDKVYDGEVSDITGGRVFLRNIRDIGSILHRDVRVSVDFASSISYESEDGYYKYDVQIKNISSGGMCFDCECDMDMDLIYETVIDWARTPMIVKLKILRKEKDDNRNISYGCSFIDLLQEEEAMLRAGVYYIQATKFRPRRSNVSNGY